ncbi:MAG: DUF3563 family protein [Rubrivivax sp.]|nr:DUF3563 family protein [Rubrivivax sp.]
MFTLIHLFHAVIEAFRPQRDRDESYLAQSADLCDLERRIRTLDERGRDPAAGITLGLYAR